MNEIKTGLELIAEERKEQIEKHGWTLKHDREVNKNKELEQAARYCLMLAGLSDENVFWPTGWSNHFHHKILNKSSVQQMIIAGAFLLAENDRRGDRLWVGKIEEIAAEIDRRNPFNKWNSKKDDKRTAR